MGIAKNTFTLMREYTFIGGLYMNNDEKRLSNKIYYYEDMLLRCKDDRKAEQIRNELVKMRVSLSKMKFRNSESSPK